MGITHYVKTPSGDTYTDRNGNEKEGTVTIGRVVENARGSKMVILDCIPFSWFSAGKPVLLYLNAIEDKGNRNGGGGDAPTESRAPAPRQAPAAGTDPDDIPF